MNLARICVASPSKPSTVLAFSMIWFKSSDFHQVHDLQVWFSSSSSVKLSGAAFWNLPYRWKIFLHVSRCLRNWHSSDDRMTDFDQVLRLSSSDFHQVHDFQVWFSSSSSFKLSDAAFWNFAYRRKIFLVCQSVHTKTTQQLDRRYYKKQCFDWIKSDQIKQIKSDQIKSNQIRSDQACLHRLVILWERQSRCVLYEKTSIRSLWLSLKSVFVRCKEWDSIERILMRWSRSSLQ
jgi:hypothetical protein